MSKRHTLNHGRQAFLDYYSHLLPQFTPPEKLDSYLTSKNSPVILVSPFHASEIQALWQKEHLSWQPLSWFPHALSWPAEVPVGGATLPGFKQGWLYPLNPSSLLPTLALNPQPGESVLDACAAPGGKTLSLASLLYPHPPHLIAADASWPRFKHLRTVLKLFGYPTLPTLHSSVQALSHHLSGPFDKILLDAPCSSEKHVYNSKHHLKIWSPNRTATLSHLQNLLITSLLPLLKPGGTLIYSTCALTPAENEAVVAGSLSRHPELILTSLSLPSTQPPSPGLPDHGLAPIQCRLVFRLNSENTGFDPMFIAALRKSPTAPAPIPTPA